MDEWKVIWYGRSGVFIGMMRNNEGTIEFKQPHPWIPFLSKWKPLLSNIGSHIDNFSERKLVNASQGVTDQTIRLYPFDIHTFEPFYPDMNQDLLRQIGSLKRERDFLSSWVGELKQLLEAGATEDGVKDVMKRNYSFYHDQIKPAWTPNQDTDKKKK